MITKDRRGLKEAIEYLKSAMPVRLITDRLYMLAKCAGKVESLGYSLRREARKPDNTNRVNVSYSPDESGRDVAYYTWNSDYKPQNKAKDRPRLYFYSLKGICQPSPYFESAEAALAHCAKHGAKPLNIYTGIYEAPVLVEAE